MSQIHSDQVIALIGVFQTATLVDQLANQGRIDAVSFETSIASLFQLTPQSVADVFPQPSGLKCGLNCLQAILQREQNPQYFSTLRYSMNLLHLERRLANDSKMMHQIKRRIQESQRQVEHFHHTHLAVIGSLASIYLDTIATLGKRIQVRGDYNYLQQNEIADKVRALLLAGIRSAMLWRQLGGKRWQMIVFRRRFLDMLKTMQQALPESVDTVVEVD